MSQHSHSCGDSGSAHHSQRYVLLGCISILIGLVQMAGSVLSGSISLFSDTMHVASDGLGFFISAYVVMRVARSHLSESETQKLRSFWMRVSGLILLPSVPVILYEAWERFLNPADVVGYTVMIAAAIGAGGNYVQLRLMPHQHNVTGRMQNLHVISDLLSSFLVIAAGCAVWVFGANWVDPLLSVGIAFWILCQTLYLMWTGESAHNHTD